MWNSGSTSSTTSSGPIGLGSRAWHCSRLASSARWLSIAAARPPAGARGEHQDGEVLAAAVLRRGCPARRPAAVTESRPAGSTSTRWVPATASSTTPQRRVVAEHDLGVGLAEQPRGLRRGVAGVQRYGDQAGAQHGEVRRDEGRRVRHGERDPVADVQAEIGAQPRRGGVDVGVEGCQVVVVRSPSARLVHERGALGAAGCGGAQDVREVGRVLAAGGGHRRSLAQPGRATGRYGRTLTRHAAATFHRRRRSRRRRRRRRPGIGRRRARSRPRSRCRSTPRAAAFFDVDNTVMQGASIFHLARGLYARDFFTARDIGRFAWQQGKFRLLGRENIEQRARGARDRAVLRRRAHRRRADDDRRGGLRRGDGREGLAGHPRAGPDAPRRRAAGLAGHGDPGRGGLGDRPSGWA